ncbi:hypothetical protein OG564_28725 [Streptomyces sp. NBC_01280]|uniref:hypothetical protein n=1 Tax=Streptomyces sp. NBC_01280 TaxID=2903810 RepID=UPI002E381708|nr:hypothetical protein [Streptomyces sp. NBC_01280]
MIYESRDGAAVTASRPRLLPWANLDGNPCYLLTDSTGTSHLSRVADNVEAVQLGMADDLLDHAADLLGDSRATASQLRFLASRLTESLHDVHRIARSRGARLPAPHDDPALDGMPEEEDPGT